MSFVSIKKLFASLSLLACTTAFAGPLTVDIAGINSYGEVGDTRNTVLTFNVGANSRITTISYSVNVTAYQPSWLSELSLLFTDSTAANGVYFNPGVGVAAPGTASYSGSADLDSLGLSFAVGADGILRLEFYEDFDDSGLSPDGRWNFGTITFGVDGLDEPAPVPEPASVLLVAGGLAALGYGRRRRAGLKAGQASH